MLKFEQLSVQLFCWLCQFVINNVDHFSLQNTHQFLRRAVHSKCISLFCHATGTRMGGAGGGEISSHSNSQHSL
jgi:hypothetical protein